MVPVHHRPAPPLDRFVDCLWYFDQPSAGHAAERALPTGTVELVFDLRCGGATICGAHSTFFVIDTSQPTRVVGVHFRPGGAAPFLGAPSCEFTDRHLSLEDAWTRAAADDLAGRLREARDSAALFGILEQALVARLRPRLLPDPALAYALAGIHDSPALARIGELREETGYSAKRLIELFRGSVGLSPKVYTRIRRFQAVIERLSSGRPVEWCDVALDCGFCDQSHLTREFRAFSGLTPGEYRPVDPRRPNHVAMDSLQG